MVAATLELAGGQRLPGYVLAPWVVVVFAGGREFVFNRGLPHYAERAARALAAELCAGEEAVLPLRFRTLVAGRDGAPATGEFALG